MSYTLALTDSINIHKIKIEYAQCAEGGMGGGGGGGQRECLNSYNKATEKDTWCKVIQRTSRFWDICRMPQRN